MKARRRKFRAGSSIPKPRLSIDGWRVTYYEPTFGTRSFVETTHTGLAKAKKWLDAGGYSYTVKGFTNGLP